MRKATIGSTSGVVAEMPRARVNTAMAVKTGCFASIRNAKRESWRMGFIFCPSAISRSTARSRDNFAPSFNCLLGSKRDDGVDTKCALRGEPAGDNRGKREDGSNEQVNHWFVGRDLKQDGAQGAG